MLPTTFYGNQKQPLIIFPGNSLEVLPLEGEILGDFCTEELPWVCHERPPVMGDIFSQANPRFW